MISPDELNSLLTVMRQHGCTLLEHDGLRLSVQPMMHQADLPNIPIETAHSGIKRLDIAALKSAASPEGF